MGREAGGLQSMRSQRVGHDRATKRLPWWLSSREPAAMQEMWIQSLGWEDALEKEMTTHSSILAWEILRTEEPGGL